jgi:dTDP-4-dehydrorhamnose reductase
MRILIVGNGYIGKRCAGEWNDSVLSDRFINSVDEILELIDTHKPDAVLNAAGVVGKPNVDWCETNQLITFKGNLLLPLLLAEACAMRNIYLLHIGSGCVFYGKSPDSKGWKEDDFANPTAVYTKSKYAADLALSTFSNVGIARIRMPIDSLPGKSNLIDKLVSYTHVADVNNSVTVVDDMIKVFHDLLEKKASGLFHVTNLGSIRHKEILALYEEFVDSNHKNEWVTENELVEYGLVKKMRSNNILQSNNLKTIGIQMRPIGEAIRDVVKKYAENKNRL